MYFFTYLEKAFFLALYLKEKEGRRGVRDKNKGAAAAGCWSMQKVRNSSMRLIVQLKEGGREGVMVIVRANKSDSADRLDWLVA